MRTDWPELVAEALSTFGTRFGSAGVYAGYATMVDRQSDDPSLLMHGRVLAYTLTSWVPHVVYPDKPVHPFRDIGYLIRENFSSRFDTVYAPTLVGYAWADFGLVSVVTYLFFGAFALGWLRRLVSADSTPILAVVGYLHFDARRGRDQPDSQRLPEQPGGRDARARGRRARQRLRQRPGARSTRSRDPQLRPQPRPMAERIQPFVSVVVPCRNERDHMDALPRIDPRQRLSGGVAARWSWSTG